MILSPGLTEMTQKISWRLLPFCWLYLGCILFLMWFFSCVVDMFENTIKIMVMMAVGCMLPICLWGKPPQGECSHEFKIYICLVRKRSLHFNIFPEWHLTVQLLYHVLHVTCTASATAWQKIKCFINTKVTVQGTLHIQRTLWHGR